VNKRKIYSDIFNEKIMIEHDMNNYIHIHDQPKEMPHSSNKTLNRLQNITMMDFQAKLSMVLRAIAKHHNINLPLPKREYGIDIKITTKRQIEELPIINTAKAIIDAINKEVINNDAEIFYLKVNIYPIPSKSRNANSKPSDEIDLDIYDLSSNQTIIGFKRLTTYIVTKDSPYLAGGFDDEFFYPHIEMYYYPVRQALLKDGFRISTANSYSVKMCFAGAVQSKDLDNMAKTYLPIMKDIAAFNYSDILEIELYKKHCSHRNASVEIFVDCNSLQP